MSSILLNSRYSQRLRS